MLERAVRRLHGLTLLFAALVVVAWILPVAVHGQLVREFTSPHDWLPASGTIVASLLVALLARSSLVSHSQLLTVGLFYQVVVSFGLASSHYLGAFRGIDAAYFTGDRVGFSTVALWMFLYSVLIPSRPARALIALLGSASAVPITIAFLIRVGEVPVLEPQVFFFIFIFPYLLCAIAAYLATLVIFHLGRELKRAQEMGSYRLEVMLGRGGMGEVWRARHRLLVRPAAIKLIRPDVTGSRDPRESAGLLKRFEREAQATASLASHHSVDVYDFGTTEDGAFYYVMELLDGLDLETLVQRHGPVAPGRVVYLLLQACHSLADAHHQGLIHRDIKPANIFACQKGLDYDFIKVLDFGLVALQADARGDATRLTADGRVAGTPAYLAPEMATSIGIDGRTDLYALGCVGYWLLTGQLVFEEETPMAAILAHATREPTPPSEVTETEVPEELEQIILSCLKKKQDDRPQSADDLAQRLRACCVDGEWSNAKARSWWESHRPLAGK